MLTFEPVSLSRQHEYLRLLRAAGPAASEYSFINLWGYSEHYELEWAWDGDLVWIRQEKPEKCLWAPIGPWKDVHWGALFERHELSGLPFVRIPEDLMFQWVAALPGRVQVEETREHWDYLYSVEELVALEGNRFHRKKNLLAQFRKKYRSAYEEAGPDLMPGLLALQDSWCEWKDCESIEGLAAENSAIERVLKEWGQLDGIMGAIVLVEDKPAAFTVGEAYTNDTLLIHFEKGLPGYTGIYQAVNQMFLDHHREFSVVNREQDLGEEGLRQAKLSYNPTGYARKYRVRLT